MIVRHGKEEDLAFVLALSKERIEDSSLTMAELADGLLFQNLGLLVLADEKDSAHGYLLLRLEGEEAEVDEIAVLAEDSGKGLGYLLLSAGEEELRKNGVKTLFLEVRTKNGQARKLYQEDGFVFYRERKGLYGNDSAYCLRKEISFYER